MFYPAVNVSYLNDVVILLLVSVLMAYICYKLKLVPIIGFLVAGILIGPHASGLIQHMELVEILAEIGVVLLLFTIGIEFSLEKMALIKKVIIVGGGLQVTISILLVTLIMLPLGVSLPVAIFTGFLIALSSTAIVLSIFNQQGKTNTTEGQLALGILIFQDIAIIAMVLLVPLLAGGGGSWLQLVLVLGQAILLIIVVFWAARYFIPWLLEKVANTRKQELFLLTIITICLGTALLLHLANISLALGAFLAGLIVSESHYSEQALSEVLPLRTIFNAIFFVSVGMLLDITYVLQYPLILLGIAFGIIVIKFLITTASLSIIKYPVHVSAVSGLALAQIGEFSFVLERAGRLAGITPAGLGELGSQLFIAVSVLLMILTPLQINLAPKLGRLLSRLLPDLKMQEPTEISIKSKLEDHVIIVGYGPAGQRLAGVLQDVGIPFIVVEMNPQTVKKMEQADFPIIFGDAGKQSILEHVRLDKAKLCIVVINDPIAGKHIVKQARYLNPTIQIIIRTRYLSEVEPLEQAGADFVIPEEMETIVHLFVEVLQAYRIKEEQINNYINKLRSGDYKILRGSMKEAHLMVLEGLDEEGLHTRAVAVRPGAPAAGKTLKELQLRNKYQVTVLAVRRGVDTMGNPAGDFTVQPEDRLVLVATAEQFVQCAHLFRDQKSSP